VIQTHKLYTKIRRIALDLPTFLIFGGIAVILTLIFKDLEKGNEEDIKEGYVDKTKGTIFTVLLSIAEASTMLTLNFIYDKVCKKLVDWENHK
jgi:hypothetical protein